MRPAELDNEQLTAVHSGADPIFFRDRPAYYAHIAETIAGWNEATLAMVRAAVKDAQYKVRGPLR
jgi:hypothetical protein